MEVQQRKIELGNKVRDRLTGVEGIVTAKGDFLSGEKRMIIQPTTDKDGKHVDDRWYDAQFVEFVDVGLAKES